MTQRVFLIVVSIFTALSGLGLLLIPAECAGFYGVALDASGDVFARFAGAIVIGLSVAFWYARDGATSMTMGPVLKGVMYAGCTAYFLTLIVVAWAAIGGAFGPAAWVTVVIHAVIAAGFMYFAELRKSPAPAM
jgi:hypothetical protein